MDIDRRRAQDAFAAYVAAYDADNPRIALKIEHTERVAALCERIARSEGLPKRDVDLAWLCGMLHDIGRFEQVRRWGTFSDAASAPHAELGVQVLFEGLVDDAGARALAGERGAGVVGFFVEGRDDDEVLRAAVGAHSGLRVPEGLDARTRMFCDILRDADKVDILHACCTCDKEAVFNVGEEAMLASPISPAVAQAFYAHRCVRREDRRHPADLVLGFACFAYELVYDESVRAMAEQGHLFELLELPFERPETRAAIAAMRAHLAEWLADRLR